MSEFIYNTADVVSQAASVPEPQFLGYELCDQKDPILTTKLNIFEHEDSIISVNISASEKVKYNIR